MKRTLLKSLISWKSKSERKPILIDGARQTGKTYLLRNLLGKEFANTLHLDFLENPEFKEAFDDSLTPHDILMNIEIMTSQRFHPETDLLILDEIGECERAATSLKYFAEKTPTYFVVASGSNVGLLNTFPVGKVEHHNLRPMTFREFLYASQESALIRAFEAQSDSAVVRAKLLDMLADYYFTGGMPEAVATWYRYKGTSILESTKKVHEIHSNLLEGYRRDFGKYSGKVDALLIQSVFDSIAEQLSSVMDQSVKRFKFKNVHQRKSRYNDFENAIRWLTHCHLALANFPIEGMPRTPFAAYRKKNMVKLFLFDVGLLNHMLGTGYREIKQKSHECKGYIAENFVQQELAAIGLDPSYSWNDARAEIEFVIANDKGEIVPIEVKSGKRTRAKSLQSYIDKCAPSKTFKLTGTRGSQASEQTNMVMPLYYAMYVPRR